MIKHTCPFGSTCIKTDTSGNTIERCRLFVEMQVKNNVTEEVENKGECSITWNVILQHETNTRVLGVQQATESFRNEMVKSTEVSSELMLASLLQSQRLNGIGHDSTNQ